MSRGGQTIRRLRVSTHSIVSFHSRLTTKTGRSGIVPVHLNPHPRRSHHSQGGSLPFQLRYSAPTFEKSNVLVL